MKYSLLIVLGILLFTSFNKSDDFDEFIYHKINLENQNLRMFWKDDKGDVFKNFRKLKSYINSNCDSLVFAMNGGMYKKDNSPLGLYVENGKILNPVNKVKEAYGNFYLQPNGIFYITNRKTAVVCKTTDFKESVDIKYATQSGPMLVIDGDIHPKFNKESKSVHIRNGVGILPNGNVIFAITTKKVNLYKFASFFKSKGCENALYLDGFVSKMFLPSKNKEDKGGNFGVIIGEVKN